MGVVRPELLIYSDLFGHVVAVKTCCCKNRLLLGLEGEETLVKGKKILFTGAPGCGKSTLIERIIKGLDRPACGFFTREIREGSKRIGFSITTLDGRSGILAREGLHSPYRVGRYGVCIEDIEQIAVPSMASKRVEEIVVVDEIGKMECMSALFRDALIAILDSDQPVIGSVALRGNLYIEGIKRRYDVQVVEVTAANRDELAGRYRNFF
jgi:nucleoside-triphosphatase